MNSKTSILRVTASFFDPLGMLSAFTITPKMLFQGLCTSKTDLDEPLHAGTQAQWKKFSEILILLSKLKIP